MKFSFPRERAFSTPSQSFELHLLERRLLLAAQPSQSTLLSTFNWANVNPELVALTIQGEQSDPRFAAVFNADLAANHLPPVPAAVPGTATLTSALARKPKAHAHKPQLHKPRKVHRPVVKPHKPLIDKPKPGHHVLHGGGSGLSLSHFTSTQPAVTGSNFIYDNGYLPQQLGFTFNEAVGATSWPSAVTVQNVSTGLALSLSSSAFSFNSTTDTLTISLGSSRIADGNYVATLWGSQITDGSGNKLAGSDGVAGDPYNYNFSSWRAMPTTTASSITPTI